jgi:hypothetical protein
MTIRTPLRLAVAVPLLFTTAACGLGAESGVEGRFDRMLSVDGAVILAVGTGSGSIAIRQGAPDAVHVVARIRGRAWLGGNLEERIRRIEATPPIEQRGNVLRIGHITDRDLVRNISISYEVTTPAEATVQSQTGSGDQTIDDVRGPVAISTGSGSIQVRRIVSDVNASTGSGDIDGDDLRAGFAGRTGSGSIHVNGIGGAARARTGSGDVDIVTGSGSIDVTGARQGLRVRAPSGDIRLDGRPGRDWTVSIASGSIRVRFAPDSAFELNARTASGGVDVSHPITLAGASTRSRVQGTVRGGGPLVELDTASGSIQID